MRKCFEDGGCSAEPETLSSEETLGTEAPASKGQAANDKSGDSETKDGDSDPKSEVSKIKALGSVLGGDDDPEFEGWEEGNTGDSKGNSGDSADPQSKDKTGLLVPGEGGWEKAEKEGSKKEGSEKEGSGGSEGSGGVADLSEWGSSEGSGKGSEEGGQVFEDGPLAKINVPSEGNEVLGLEAGPGTLTQAENPTKENPTKENPTKESGETPTKERVFEDGPLAKIVHPVQGSEKVIEDGPLANIGNPSRGANEGNPSKGASEGRPGFSAAESGASATRIIPVRGNRKARGNRKDMLLSANHAQA